MAINLDPSRKFGTFEEQIIALARAFRDEASLLLPVYRGVLGPEAEGDYLREGLRAGAIDLNRFTPARFAQLLKTIRSERIELVHWHFYHPLGNPYLWSLSVAAPRVRHVFTDHISRPTSTEIPVSGLRAVVKRRLLRRYRAVLCVSHHVLDSLRTQGTWPELHRVTHFVNTARFAPDAAARLRVRRELGETRPFIALVIAHLIPEKGVETAVRALAALPPTAGLWVIGDGPEAGRLEALAQALGVADRVRWLGLQRQVEPFLQAADVLVCPSIWAEAAGLVNIEALAAGLPVVASAVGGIPEIVDDGRTGYLVPSGDPGALASRLRRLHDEPDTLGDLAAEARATALARFSTEALVPEYLDLYRSLTREPAAVVLSTIPR
jgi:glycosyltransferase involved in cell wall biosynthesis